MKPFSAELGHGSAVSRLRAVVKVEITSCLFTVQEMIATKV
jgi:hypothetical protein